MVNFLEEHSMRTECTRGKMETATSENGKTIKCTGLEPFQMEKKSLFCANILTGKLVREEKKGELRKRSSNTGNECKTQ